MIGSKPGSSAGYPPLVLVVDDDPDIRCVLQEYLVQHELRVMAASNERAMLEVIEQESVDLILLDVMMPPSETSRSGHTASPGGS